MRIVFVDAALEDAQKIFDWRNAPDSRRYSGNSEKISWEDHQRWFAEVLADPSRYLMIAKSEGADVGVLRLDVDECAAEVSIYVVPGTAGRGFGTAILGAAIDWVRINLTVDCLTAKVSVENSASIRLFTKAGFALIDKTESAFFFKRESRA